MVVDVKRALTDEAYRASLSLEDLAETAKSADEPSRATDPPRPGLVVVFSAGRALCRIIPFVDGVAEIGRDAPALGPLRDPLLSRKHARVANDGRCFAVRDLDSRNGTSLDGKALAGETRTPVSGPDGGSIGVLRAGGTLFLLTADARAFEAGVEQREGMVMGPALRAVWSAIARAAQHGATLHLRGESGSGKDLAARAFHALGPSSRGPFVPVNCAAIPEALAERLLFGARRGAFSGATADADGYVQAAHGGTLFLDEVAELGLGVQAKLLRAIESREVLPLGAVAPVPVDVRICTASHKDLRAEVAAGRLREDFYFRVARPDVTIPPLRERREEIPMIVVRAIDKVAPALSAHVSLAKACLLRHWPGNVRELVAEILAAVQLAVAEDSEDVKERHLAPNAGKMFEHVPSPRLAEARASAPQSEGSRKAGAGNPSARVAVARRAAPGADELEALMSKHRGVIQDIADELGCSRRQIGRWLDEHGIDRSRFRA
jgi:DNA-binding NtrC family response regulator